MRLLFAIVLFPLSLLATQPPAIQHNPWTTTTNDPNVTVAATQPVSITTPSPIALEVNGLISTTYEVNTPINVRSFAPTNWIWGVDDTAVIQDALNSLPGSSTLAVPPGLYQVTALQIPATGGHPVIELSQGATIKHLPTCTASLATVVGTNETTVVIRGPGVLDGNWQSMPMTQMTNVPNNASILVTTNQNQHIECYGVVFTNSVRAAAVLGGSGSFVNCTFANIKTNLDVGVGTQRGIPGNTFAIYSQPQGYNPDLHLYVAGCKFFGQTGLDTNLVWSAARGIWVTEQISDSDWFKNTNRNTVTVIGNYFEGLGGNLGYSGHAAIGVYNGCERPVIVGNTINTFSLAAIDVQRSGNVIIANNTCVNGFNYSPLPGFELGNSSAIAWNPMAREGEHPFGPVDEGRTNEVRYGAIITGNVVTNCQQEAFNIGTPPLVGPLMTNYTWGCDAIIANNLVDTMALGKVPAVVHILGDRVKLVHNKFRNIKEYAVVATGNYTNIEIVANEFTTTDSSITNTAAILSLIGLQNSHIDDNRFYFTPGSDCTAIFSQGLTNCSIHDNFFVNAGLAISVRTNANNVLVDRNTALNSLVGDFSVDVTSTNVWDRDNSWSRNTVNQSIQAPVYLTVSNHDAQTNSLSSAYFVASVDHAEAYFGAHPTNYADTTWAQWGEASVSTEAVGWGVKLHSNQTFRVKYDNVSLPNLESTALYNRMFSTNSTALLLESSSPFGTFVQAANQSTNVGQLRWNGVGFAVLDSTGMNENLAVADNGNTTVRGTLDAKAGSFVADGTTVSLIPSTVDGPVSLTSVSTSGGSARWSLANSASDTNAVLSVNNGNFIVQASGGSNLLSGTTYLNDLYATNDVSALTFTDRSRSPTNLTEALAIVRSIETTNSHVNHLKLHPSAWGTRRERVFGTTNIVVVPDQTKRDLGMVVSAQGMVIANLTSRVDTLESEVKGLIAIVAAGGLALGGMAAKKKYDASNDHNPKTV